MPTVLRWNGFRFYFFSNEGYEPPHIHIDRAGNTIKFWLNPFGLARNIGFSERDVALFRQKVAEEQAHFLEAWHGYFGVSN